MCTYGTSATRDAQLPWSGEVGSRGDVAAMGDPFHHRAPAVNNICSSASSTPDMRAPFFLPSTDDGRRGSAGLSPDVHDVHTCTPPRSFARAVLRVPVRPRIPPPVHAWVGSLRSRRTGWSVVDDHKTFDRRTRCLLLGGWLSGLCARTPPPFASTAFARLSHTAFVRVVRLHGHKGSPCSNQTGSGTSRA